MTILSLGPGAFRPRDEELPSSEPPTEVPPLVLKFGELDLLMCVGVEQGVRLGLSNLVRTVKTNSPLRICCKNKKEGGLKQSDCPYDKGGKHFIQPTPEGKKERRKRTQEINRYGVTLKV